MYIRIEKNKMFLKINAQLTKTEKKNVFIKCVHDSLGIKISIEPN